MPRSRSRSSARAVRKTIGIFSVRSSSRSSSATRQPSRPGIITSSRITSGISARAVSSPLGPSAASSTSIPSASRLTRQSSRIGASSSITRTRVLIVALSLSVRISHTLVRERQLECEARASAFFRVDPHPATHLAHEALGYEQAEARALRAACLVELREDPLLLGGGNADALVLDRDLDRVVDHARGHGDDAFRGRVLDRDRKST